MHEVEKFKSDLDQALRRAGAGAGAGAAPSPGSPPPAGLRAFFERSFPGVRGETGAAILADFAEKWRADPAAALAWLGTVGSILLQDYDGEPLSREDWVSLREAFSAGSEEVDIDLLTYAMSLVLDHGAL